MKYLLWSLMVSIAWGATQVKENHRRFDQTPYVLQISIDGYRHDYNDLYNPPTLVKFARAGVRAKSLIPVFPSKTFPNHLSLVTGLYPGRHGIVANHFYAPKLKKHYSLKDRGSVRNARFYTGIPLWNLASLNRMVSAVYFWPGSEAAIGGHFPSHYVAYNHSTPHIDRINKVIEWMKLPRSQRPHYVSLYFSDVDSAGHRYGPRSKGVKEAVLKVDASLKLLLGELSKLKLELNIIIVSDHGMTRLDESKKITIDTSPVIKQLLKSFHIQGKGPIMFLYYHGQPSKKQKTINQLIKQLAQVSSHYQTYRRSNLPRRFHGNNNPRMGDIILMADPPYSLGIGQQWSIPKGDHGYDGIHRDMHGIFLARGPQLKTGLAIESLENIHIYPLIARILGPPVRGRIDGDFRKVKNLLVGP